MQTFLASRRQAHPQDCRGIDNIFAGPACRVVDSQHALGMAEYAIWSVLLFHRMMDLHLQNAAYKRWERPEQVVAQIGANTTRILAGQARFEAGSRSSAY